MLDAPGHRDFIPNMICGANQADCAILVVDATRGEFETGFETGGQTREHALLVRSLGVSQIGVAVNKLDNEQWSQERFDEIVGKLKIFLKQAGFKDSDVSYIPCSGLTGENLVKSATEPDFVKWYNGPTLIQVIGKDFSASVDFYSLFLCYSKTASRHQNVQSTSHSECPSQTCTRELARDSVCPVASLAVICA